MPVCVYVCVCMCMSAHVCVRARMRAYVHVVSSEKILHFINTLIIITECLPVFPCCVPSLFVWTALHCMTRRMLPCDPAWGVGSL